MTLSNKQPSTITGLSFATFSEAVSPDAPVAISALWGASEMAALKALRVLGVLDVPGDNRKGQKYQQDDCFCAHLITIRYVKGIDIKCNHSLYDQQPRYMQT